MINNIEQYIRDVPDFPKEGILFKDITPLLQNFEAFKSVIDEFYAMFKNANIHKIAAIDARGYLFGAPLAYKLGCGLVLVRKAGKLPAAKISESYDLEYGKNSIEIHKDAVTKGENVLIIDDLLATGGTTKAAYNLLNRLGANIVGAAFVIELTDLNGSTALTPQMKTFSLIKY